LAARFFFFNFDIFKVPADFESAGTFFYKAHLRK